jgi:LmbE family N-acetylglucosaminyl deacetylase
MCFYTSLVYTFYISLVSFLYLLMHSMFMPINQRSVSNAESMRRVNPFINRSRRVHMAEAFASRKVSWKRRGGWLSRFAIISRNLPRVSEISSEVLPKKRVLVLAPHPEEPVEKCFATIHGFLKSGSDVHVHVLTTGAHGVDLSAEHALRIQTKTINPRRAELLAKIKIRLKELRSADKILGLGEKNKSIVHSMDFYDQYEVSRSDLNLMKNIIGDGKWDIVIMPDRLDLQPSHAAVYDMAIKYLRRAARRNKKPIELWGFETTYHRHPLSELNQTVSYSGEVQDKKMQAVKAHKSQDDRRGAYTIGRFAEAEQSSAIAEERGGFGSPVAFSKAQRVEAFSVKVLKAFGPFVRNIRKN